MSRTPAAGGGPQGVESAVEGGGSSCAESVELGRWNTAVASATIDTRRCGDGRTGTLSEIRLSGGVDRARAACWLHRPGTWSAAAMCDRCGSGIENSGDRSFGGAGASVAATDTGGEGGVGGDGGAACVASTCSGERRDSLPRTPIRGRALREQTEAIHPRRSQHSVPLLQTPARSQQQQPRAGAGSTADRSPSRVDAGLIAVHLPPCPSTPSSLCSQRCRQTATAAHVAVAAWP